MEEAYLQELLAKYKAGSLSAAEKQELDKWYLSKAGEDGFMVEPLLVIQRLAELHEAFAFVDDLAVKKVRLWPRIAVAASIALAVIAGGYFYVKDKNADRNVQIAENDIAPGKNGATLTLADGKKILVSDALTGNIASEAGVKISKTANGQLVYEVLKSGSGELQYNTLSTSRGQQSQVRLPDGSVVFLNAASSLRYPTSFVGASRREVILSGEGYFEVAKDKVHPFVVVSAGQRVEVLGTHFNIDSYNDGLQTKTTLVEGTVKVSGKKGEMRLLKPNEQAILSGNGIAVKQVEAEYEIAWKEGFFMFNNQSLEHIMERVALWYDVQVSYGDSSLKNERFIGTISKFENISKVLTMLQKTKVATFKLEGKKVIVERIN